MHFSDLTKNGLGLGISMYGQEGYYVGPTSPAYLVLGVERRGGDYLKLEGKCFIF